MGARFQVFLKKKGYNHTCVLLFFWSRRHKSTVNSFYFVDINVRGLVKTCFSVDK